MTFIHVISLDFQMSKCTQNPDATDAQNDFLTETIIRITAIEPVGQGTVKFGITFDIGVQQVDGNLVAADALDPAVMTAMARVARHEFVPASKQSSAYDNRPLPIGHGQTISQPYIVALMTQLLELKGTEKVLEVGTGSGYQAAVLSHLVPTVFTVERIDELLKLARRRFHSLRLHNIYVRYADGHLGWPSQAPFDGIMVTAAAQSVPRELLEQLAVGGLLMFAVGMIDDYRPLSALVRFLVPVMILVTGYVLWLGGHAAGGDHGRAGAAGDVDRTCELGHRLAGVAAQRGDEVLHVDDPILQQIADARHVAFEQLTGNYRVVADARLDEIDILGKPIGNGHPMAAVVTTPEIAASFANGIAFGAGTPTLACNDVFGNEGSNYGGVADPTGTDGNVSEDPQFCGVVGTRDWTLQSDSPCLADCGRIGARGSGRSP